MIHVKNVVRTFTNVNVQWQRLKQLKRKMKRIKLNEEQFKQLVELNMDDLIGTEVIDKPIYGMNTLNTEQESIDVEPDVEGYVSLEETDEIDEGADLEGPSKYGYGNDAPFKDSPNFNVGESVTADTLGDVIKYAIRETLNEEWENPCDGVGLNPTQYEDCLGNCCATMGGECCNEKTTGIGKGMTSDSKSVMDSEGALKRTELIKKKMALRDKQVQRKKMNENSHHLVHSDQRDVTEDVVGNGDKKDEGCKNDSDCAKTSDYGGWCREGVCIPGDPWNQNTTKPTQSRQVRREDKDRARRKPYSSRYRDMRGSRDMGKMNEEKKKKGTKSGEPCTCNEWIQLPDGWKCFSDTPTGCITGNQGMTTKEKGTKKLNEGPYCKGGCPENHTCTWHGCKPNFTVDGVDNKVKTYGTNDYKGRR